MLSMSGKRQVHLAKRLQLKKQIEVNSHVHARRRLKLKILKRRHDLRDEARSLEEQLQSGGENRDVH